MEQFVLSVLVDNHSGVLARVTSLFGRKGYNIESLTVSATENDQVSRITVVAKGDIGVLEQVMGQLRKLEDVYQVTRLQPETSLFREILLLKVCADQNTRNMIKDTADIFNARIVDVTSASLIFELTGAVGKINAFLDLMKPYGILEMSRTGVTAMARGNR